MYDILQPLKRWIIFVLNWNKQFSLHGLKLVVTR